MKTLETERLILRDWDILDLDAYFKLVSNPNITIPDGCYQRKQRKNVCQSSDICYKPKTTMHLF